jgi:hypothetical protein
MPNLNALADVQTINTWAELTNKHGENAVNPEIFYCKQLLDTIRIDGDQYVYYRLADTQPIQEKADKLLLRRWAPLQAHTVPLIEGIPPMSDKASLEKYEIQAYQYGRYMEFSDKIDFAVVDPVAVHYTREYSLVAMETLDMLARETLFTVAQKFYAGGAIDYEGLTVDDKPQLEDLRLIVLGLKRALVKPRINGRYQVIASPEFYYDMVHDPLVESYMRINQTTKTMYDNSQLVPLFEMEFYETLVCPTSGEFRKIPAGGTAAVLCKRMYRYDPTLNSGAGGYEYETWQEDETDTSGNPMVRDEVDVYLKDSRTGQDASAIPKMKVWDEAAWNAVHDPTGTNPWSEFKSQRVLVVGKDALTRTGLAGEDQTRMYVKQKGSAGVLDPIDQRQSIGFKINSVGFGSTRLEAIVEYLCVPTTVNPV